MVWQLLKLDEPTRKMMKGALPKEFFPVNTALKGPLLFNLDPVEFTHAYMLLGSHPSRFGYDLSLYLGTVNTYFDRSPENEIIHIVGASQDAKKRLSEDLGVAVASAFMVKSFGVRWETISQIPLNNKLSKKRPDFEGFDPGGRRFLFEAKGTTKTANIEAAIGKAIEQVKGYPEEAEGKLAITSFFSTDDRLFDSTTFVVDPPMPDIVPPDEETSRLLHNEKILQFSGFKQTSVEYLRVLERMLKDQHKAKEEGVTVFREPPRRPRSPIDEAHETELSQAATRIYRDTEYFGQELVSEVSGRSVRIFLGVSAVKLEKLLEFDESESQVFEPFYDEYISIFSDGTILQIEIGKK